MTEKQALNQLAKNKRKRDKEFKTMYQTCVKKVRKMQHSKDIKRSIINDLQKCENIDLMKHLSLDDIKTSIDYQVSVNKFLELEFIAYDYPVRPVYVIGILGQICEIIRKRHKYLDFKKEMFTE